jgi:hypothetical protein
LVVALSANILDCVARSACPTAGTRSVPAQVGSIRLNLFVEAFFHCLGGAAFADERRKMDRSFVVAQISDLHLDGSGRLLPTIETLRAAICEKMAAVANVPDRILLITGDLVDDPTPRALDEALAVIASFRQTGLFTDIQAVAGNHDVKRASQRAGRHDVYDYLHLPRTAKCVYYRQAGLDLVLLDSNRARLMALAGGEIDESAYKAMVADSARLSAELAGSIGSAGRADYAEPADNLVRVLALHHHPLPQATGEGKTLSRRARRTADVSRGICDLPRGRHLAQRRSGSARSSPCRGADPLFHPGSACDVERER